MLLCCFVILINWIPCVLLADLLNVIRRCGRVVRRCARALSNEPAGVLQALRVATPLLGGEEQCWSVATTRLSILASSSTDSRPLRRRQWWLRN
jgi:hypothetical protein